MGGIKPSAKSNLVLRATSVSATCITIPTKNIKMKISADIARRVGYIREDYWIPKRG